MKLENLQGDRGMDNDKNEINIGGENMIEMKQVKSKASCKVSDIKGFVFGGFSSRFWLLRKHINYF
jgi:hypothetical protein